MQRIILTTCGTSLLTSNCFNGINNKPAVSKSKAPQERAQREFEYRQFIQSKRDEDKTGKTLANEFAEHVWNDTSALAKMPAELASLKVIQLFFKNRDEELNSNDCLKLLHADNVDAIFCANVIGNILKKKNLLNDITLESLRKLEGLDPSKIDKFSKSIESYWKGLFDEMPWQSEDKIEKLYLFNLTGGYKSTVMLLSCFAYFKGIKDTYIFYLNEEAGYEEVLVMGYDAENSLESGLSSLQIGYVEPDTGELISKSLVFPSIK